MERWHAVAPSVAVVLKTGSSVMSSRLPNLLSDYLRHVPNLLVVCDSPTHRGPAGRGALLAPAYCTHIQPRRGSSKRP